MTDKLNSNTNMSSNVRSSSSSVYIPANAKINFSFSPLVAPEVKYEKRKWSVDRESFKNKVEKR